jgi:endosialidase-like protein
MSNTHVQPDHAAELQAIHADLLSPAVLAATWAVPVPPAMTLSPFEVYGYVLAGSPARLTYVYQSPVSLALTGSDGAYWVAIHVDTATPVSGWTRRVGSHLLWQAAGAPPADPPGGLVALGVTVAGGVITALDGTLALPSTRVAFGGPRGQLRFDKHLTWDGATLRAVQRVFEGKGHTALDTTGDNAVGFYSTVNSAGGSNRWAIYTAGDAPTRLGGTLTVVGQTSLGAGLTVTGDAYVTGQLRGAGSLYSDGPATLASTLQVNGGSQLGATVTVGMIGTAASATLDVNGSVRARTTLQVDATSTLVGAVGIGGGADGAYSLRSYGNSYFDGKVGFAATPAAGARVMLGYNKSAESGLAIQQTVADAGNASVLFLNNGGGICGTITTSSTTTSYNTTSDARLKEHIAPLPDPVGVVQALRPVAFRWREGGAAGQGFLAHELQRLVPEAVHGEAGGRDYQQADYSKLIPWLTAALQHALRRLERLERTRCEPRSTRRLPH